jgi:hypothetical protein
MVNALDRGELIYQSSADESSEFTAMVTIRTIHRLHRQNKICVICGLILVIFLVTVASCTGSRTERAKELMSEANGLLEQESKVTKEWTDEYSKVFTPQNRAQFPSNRNWLRTQGDRLIPLLDESSRLSNAAAEKYEQARELFGKEQERRGMALYASSLRKYAEINELLKAQMRLASDEEIKEEQTFNEKFMELMEQIQQKEKEHEDQLKEGKRLLPF